MLAQLKSWIHMLKSVGLLTKQVFVYDSSYLPRASGGKILLDANTVYNVCGAINISDRPPRRPKGSR